MFFYRLELKTKLDWNLNDWQDLYFECEHLPCTNILADNQFCYRYILYPQSWIKYENTKSDGFILYTSYYHTPEEVIYNMCKDYKGVVINTYTNEFVYKH